MTTNRTLLSSALTLSAALSLLTFAGGGCTSTSAKTAGAETAANSVDTSQIKPVVDQRAITALKEMSDALSKAKSLRFDSSSTSPFRGPNGQWLHLLKTAHVEMQRPNKLHVETGGDAFAQTILFDGKTYSVEAKGSKLYSQTEMPAETIDAMLAESAKRGGNVFSFSDVLLSDPFASWSDGLEGAVYVGESVRGNEKLSHLALAAKTVHWEVWIGEKDHLPRLVYARFVGEQHAPAVMVEFSKWHTTGAIASSRFAFKAPTGSKRATLKSPSLNSAAGAATEGKASL